MLFVSAVVLLLCELGYSSNVRVDLARGFVTCSLQLIETIPEALKEKKIKTKHKSIFDTWSEMIDRTQDELVLMTQWGIKDEGNGRKLFGRLKKLVKHSNATLRIVYFNHEEFEYDHDFTPKFLTQYSHFHNQVRYKRPRISGLTDPRVTNNVLHSKIFVVDKKDVYLGSANLGDRSTSRTKEMGLYVQDCPALANDALKQWQLYWNLDGISQIPQSFPRDLATKINAATPLKVFNILDGSLYHVFIAASPVSLTASGRSDDLTAIVRIINKAKKYIHIEVGEYLATDAYKDQRPWTVIDQSIRKAVREKGVEVRFLVNDHATQVELMKEQLSDLELELFPNVEVRLFSSQFDIHRFHGTHSKFMVTDNSAFIGTSNWTEDYFSDSAGVSVTLEVLQSGEKPTLLKELELIFKRDWHSKLAIPLKRSR